MMVYVQLKVQKIIMSLLIVLEILMAIASGWSVAGVNNATKDHTLVRKSTVTSGNAGDWNTSAGTNEDDSEWVVLDKDDWSYIGSHPHDFTRVCSDTTACNFGQSGDCTF